MSKLFIFNPTNEMAIADGGYGFMPSRYLSIFEKDLDTLPFLFAEPHDFVLVEKMPDKLWIESFSALKKTMPQFIEIDSLLKQIKSGTININSITPWGWSPRMIKRLEEIIRLLPNNEKKLPNYQWSPMHKQLYGRETALKVLNYVIQKHPLPESLITNSLAPVKAFNVSEVELLLKKYQKIVIKAPHSSSGKGVLMICKPYLNQHCTNWMLGAIKQSGYIMVEPFYDILNHFSLQFYTDASHCKTVAFGAFSCNSKGGYESNYVKGVELRPHVKNFITKINIKLLADLLSEAFMKFEIHQYYQGYFGVDILLCKHQNGNMFLNPCGEINLRQNMGLVAHFLSPWFAENVYGRFRIINKTINRNMNIIDFINSNVPIWQQGKLKEGLIALNPPINRNHVAIAQTCNYNNQENVLIFKDMV